MRLWCYEAVRPWGYDAMRSWGCEAIRWGYETVKTIAVWRRKKPVLWLKGSTCTAWSADDTAKSVCCASSASDLLRFLNEVAPISFRYFLQRARVLGVFCQKRNLSPGVCLCICKLVFCLEQAIRKLLFEISGHFCHKLYWVFVSYEICVATRSLYRSLISTVGVTPVNG
jgi:hypothetical protein